ncbi:hypothetical protein NECAME_06042 [Necator americanus]|uniref:Uncharacterized protein n=1 Tax=Necator americanus TaxID=51031 RepID=W2TYM6_NECAM|nr:hypothetical protein NECAME_06042 [Necator americanus]ETN86161.1 hypothetical protein NECAME_06042 [Necator americanus]
MHPLMTSVLAQRQLNAAGQLFTLSDYDVITDLIGMNIIRNIDLLSAQQWTHVPLHSTTGTHL